MAWRLHDFIHLDLTNTIEIDTPEFDDFVIECIGSPEMLTHEVTDSGVIATRQNYTERWEKY